MPEKSAMKLNNMREPNVCICTNKDCKLRKAGCKGFEGCSGYKGR